MTSPLVALAACRVVQDTAALLLWGGGAYLAWLVPKDLGSAVADRLQVWAAAAAVAAVMATAAELPVEAASIGDGWRDAVNPAVIVGVLTDTSSGYAWSAQAAAAALLLVLLGMAPLRAKLTGTAITAALMLAGLSLTGHAVMHEGWLGVANRANDVLHVLASGAWFGALVPVLTILPCLGRSESRAEAAIALRRFSRAGHIAVALVVATGIAGTALILKQWPIDLSSPYQVLLDVKVLAVAMMTGLAVLNRYVFVPQLPTSLAKLRRATLAEVPLGILAIALVAVFGLLDPS
ncbi:copper homeostasis membrane protein CopD [Lichenibacterium minor]|uniref:copper homeostasis membrane protein CopD n=1 Tax=Lichenibacterium minor TaxID=2316528 RepID=UPI001FDECA6D|nr:copper homeostasis membrane protein CopD [Lichenibacterium minor]